MEVLSPRSANVPVKARDEMNHTKRKSKKKQSPSTSNPDRIDEHWRPADVVREPGPDGDHYVTGKKLGKGGFAVCFEGRSKKTSELYALKIVKSHVEQQKQLEKASQVSATCHISR